MEIIIKDLTAGMHSVAELQHAGWACVSKLDSERPKVSVRKWEYYNQVLTKEISIQSTTHFES